MLLLYSRRPRHERDAASGSRTSYDAEVVCLTVNLGQPGEDYAVIEDKALPLGAARVPRRRRARGVRARVRPAGDQGQRALRRDYPLFTALGRPLIAKLAVEHARRAGCDTIAHGCTGKGNDQVRIEATVATLAPELKVIAPVRSWQMGREEEIAYAREHGIPIKPRRAPRPPPTRSTTTSGAAPRRAAGSRTSTTRPRTTSSSSSRPPSAAPDEAEVVEIEFERGVPVALDGERLGLVELLERVAAIGARHGVGIVDHIEDRIVGLKVRDIYEVPAAAILLPAHRELERLVCTIHQNQFKAGLDRQWAYLVYAGLWWEPLRADLDAYMEHVNEHVTGTIGIKLYKGHARVVTRSSPNAVYDASLASFAESGGLFSQTASPGLHRAVVAAVADGLAPAQRVIRTPPVASGLTHSLGGSCDARGIRETRRAAAAERARSAGRAPRAPRD